MQQLAKAAKSPSGAGSTGDMLAADVPFGTHVADMGRVSARTAIQHAAAVREALHSAGDAADITTAAHALQQTAEDAAAPAAPETAGTALPETAEPAAEQPARDPPESGTASKRQRKQRKSAAAHALQHSEQSGVPDGAHVGLSAAPAPEPEPQPAPMPPLTGASAIRARKAAKAARKAERMSAAADPPAVTAAAAAPRPYKIKRKNRPPAAAADADPPNDPSPAASPAMDADALAFWATELPTARSPTPQPDAAPASLLSPVEGAPRVTLVEDDPLRGLSSEDEGQQPVQPDVPQQPRVLPPMDEPMELDVSSDGEPDATNPQHAALALAPTASNTLPLAFDPSPATPTDVQASEQAPEQAPSSGQRMAAPAAPRTPAQPAATLQLPPSPAFDNDDALEDARGFMDVDALDDATRSKAVDRIFSVMPPEWQAELMSARLGSLVPLERRTKKARAALMKTGSSGVANALRALSFWNGFRELHEVPSYPIQEDMMIWCLDEYDEEARIRAIERAAARTAKGTEAPDRGGAYAVKALRNGFFQFEIVLGLRICASTTLVKAATKVDLSGLPTVRSMLPLDAFVAYEHISSDSNSTEFEQAYAGASWLTTAGVTRTIDTRRTKSLHFENADFHGTSYTVAVGMTERSKGTSRATMRALCWRAPIVTLDQQAVNLLPALASMEGGESLFRDFTTEPGQAHVITNAIAWADKTASHETVVASQKALLRAVLGEERADAVGGHDHRHVLPEVARVINVSRERREQLGYWRSQGVVGEGAQDRAAIGRAIQAARTASTKSGPLRFQSDRYSSVDADPISSDETRIMCLRLISGTLHKWRAGGGTAPGSSKKQLQAIKTYVEEHGGSLDPAAQAAAAGR